MIPDNRLFSNSNRSSDQTMAKRSGNILSRQKTHTLITLSEVCSPNVDKHCLKKQDSIPRRPHRNNSPERNMINETVVPKTWGPRSRAICENVSELSISLGSLGSFSSFFSSTDDPNLHSSGGSTSSSPNSPLRKKFSTSSRLSLFSSQPPEKKKNRRSGKKEPQTLNRWDSSEECDAKGSPKKPLRENIARACETTSRVRGFSMRVLRRVPTRERKCSDSSAISRWSSHSISSHDVSVSPRKTGSPRKPSRQPLTMTPLPSPPPLNASVLKQGTNPDQEIVFNPKSHNHCSADQHLQNEERSHAGSEEHRAILSRQPKAYNLLVQESSRSHPTATSPRLPPWNPHSNGDRTHKLKCPFEWTESKRSIATSSTRESTASSAACPDYSIPWFAAPRHPKFGL